MASFLSFTSIGSTGVGPLITSGDMENPEEKWSYLARQGCRIISIEPAVFSKQRFTQAKASHVLKSFWRQHVKVETLRRETKKEGGRKNG